MTETHSLAPRTEPKTAARTWIERAWWLGKFLLALFMLVGGLEIMQSGASSLDVLNSGGVLVRNAGTTFGLGWVGAMLVLSGAPVIATGLALVEAGSISEVQGFAMMTGARLGAAFIVLVVAVIYALRGGEGERWNPLSTAIISLLTTAIIYIPAAFLGFFLLQLPAFQKVNVSLPGEFSEITHRVYGPILSAIEPWPAMIVFFGGLGLLILSFKLLDSVVPELSEESLRGERLAWLRRKWPMFGLGCLIAIATMSVSVALTILVPLVAKNSVRRQDIIPYIMGANIGTLGDKLLPAFALDSAPAVRIVLAGIVTTLLLSVIALAFLYPKLRDLIFHLQWRVLRARSKFVLATFTASLFLVPIIIGVLSVGAG